MMRFIIESVSKHSGRIGTLTKNDFEVRTPLVLHYTKVASVPHLSREAFDLLTTEKQGIQVSIETTSTLEDVVKQFQKGIAAFSGLDHTYTFVTLKDTGRTTASYYSRNSVAITTRGGKVSLEPSKYMRLIETFKPDFFHSLCDGDTEFNCANKRMHHSVERSYSFFKYCADAYKTSTKLADSMLLAPVEGGYSLHYRKDSIEQLNSYDDQDVIGGYFLDGFHRNGESAKQLDATKVCEVVDKCNELLPTSKLKVMFGAYSPILVIQLIQLGVDVFDTTYAYLATSTNQALTFNFNTNDVQETQFAIDLADSSYKEQFEPYVKNCQCLACRNHTRAYTQHLVHTKELLASILLMIHNTHHYLEFFKAIRHHIANDTLPTLLTLISKQQTEFDAEMLTIEKKQCDSDEINSISTESNPSAFKKLKNDANEIAEKQN